MSLGLSKVKQVALPLILDAPVKEPGDIADRQAAGASGLAVPQSFPHKRISKADGAAQRQNRDEGHA